MRFLVLSCVLIFGIMGRLDPCGGKSFDPRPEVGSNQDLSQTRRRVHHEVVTSRQELIDQVESVRTATAAYIGAKIKDNLLKALSTVGEDDLGVESTMSFQDRARQPRQDDEDDEETATPEPGILPQLATILQSVFGNNVNVTKYVENASKLLPRPIGNQLVGVVSLLDPNQFTSTTEPSETTEFVPITPPPRVKTNLTSTASPNSVSANSTSTAQNETLSDAITDTTTSKPKKKASPTPTSLTSTTPSAADTTDEEDGEDGAASEEDSDDLGRGGRVKRQFDLNAGLNPMKLLDGIEAIWKNWGVTNDTAAVGGKVATLAKGASKVVTVKGGATGGSGSTTESDDGFDDDYTTKPSRVKGAVKGAASQFEALRKGVPDLFQGAREAYKFLEHLNGFLDTWENRLLAGSEDE